MIKSLLQKSLIISLLFCISIFAHANTPKLTNIPLGEFSMVEVEGSNVFMSKNGRYALKDGKIYDMWTKKDITNVKDAKQSADTLPIRKIMKDIQKLNLITFGKGSKSFFVFVDPQCNYCKAFVKAAQAYTAEYTFNLVVVPALGDESNKLAKSLYCASDKSNALNDFLNNKLGSLKQKPNCDSSGYDQTLLLAQILDIKGVPFFVSEIGFFRQGSDDGIWSWLKKTPII